MFESVEVKPAGKCPYCGKEMVEHIIKEGARYHVPHWDSIGAHCSEPKCEINHRCGICTPLGRERRASRVIGRERDPRVQEIVGKVPEHERAGLP